MPAEELCGDAPELLAELRRRIEVVRAMDSVLETESIELSATSRISGSDGGGASPKLPDALHASAVYRPQRRHAEGGLGEVLAAREEELDRVVALKRIRPDKLHDVARQRFLREAAITARLQHPGIVPIYGLGQDDNGPFYTMPLIQGQTLQEAIQAFHGDESLRRDPGQRRLKLRRLLQRFITVCDTVAYAHDQGVVHRDLKPSNIMLGPYGETLVLDWGLAKPFGMDDPAAESEWEAPSPSPSGDDLTATGAILGTPQYMSPEQAQGLPAGPASDIFSLGLILYAILTGKPAFDEASFRGADPLKAVRDAAVLPPRSRDPRLSRALEAISLKALAAKPVDRYASARDLAKDLENWLAGEPVTAWHEPWWVKARRRVVRHRTSFAAVTAALLVGVLAFLGFLYDARLRAAQNLAQANGRVDALESAEIREVPRILELLQHDRGLIRDRLRRLAQSDATGPNRSRHRLHAALALLPDEPAQAGYLVEQLLQADTPRDEVLVVRQALHQNCDRDLLAQRLWPLLESLPASLTEHLLRTAAAFALFDPTNPRWRDLCPAVANKLVQENPLLIRSWREVFQPVNDRLRGPLLTVYDDRGRPEAERALTYALLLDFATQPDNDRRNENLSDLIAEADPARLGRILGRITNRQRACAYLASKLEAPAGDREAIPRRQGRIAASLINLGVPERRLDHAPANR